MALKIRLRQQGRTNRQTYRLVVANSRSPRDGKYVEMVGWYNPFQDQNNVSVNAERVDYWISQGAQISEQVEAILSREAPAVLKALKQKRHQKRSKSIVQRRTLKKAAK